MVQVDVAFVTGNGVVVAEPDGAITIDRDIRDSTGDRWYWHVRLKAPTDTVAHVRMARPLLLGQYGPAVCRNDSYEWLHARPQPDGYFEVPVTARAAVWLCATMPYGPGDLDAFRRRTDPHAVWRTLVMSEGGRAVPLLTVPAPAARRLIVLTARHHSCEAMASYVLEGAVAEFIARRGDNDQVAQRCELFVVPMLDVDGVYHGDQGKARRPWDHNRDYGSRSRYHAVAALRSLLSGETRPTFALDLHTPGLRGPLEERPYVVASGDPGDDDRAHELLAALERADCGKSREPPEVLMFDDEWNSAASSGQRSCAAWMRSRPATRLGLTIEYPNAVDRGVPIRPAEARRFGESIMQALLTVIG
jgi:hypothetical protein